MYPCAAVETQNKHKEDEFMIDHRSYAHKLTQRDSNPWPLTHNLSSCEMKAWKQFRPERDSNPWPLRYRCSALQLSYHQAIWELVTAWVRNISVEGVGMQMNIWKIIYFWTAEKDMNLWLIIAFLCFSAVQIYDLSYILLQA